VKFGWGNIAKKRLVQQRLSSTILLPEKH